jgi:putative nucleotidyltransferase with HDIG domain
MSRITEAVRKITALAPMPETLPMLTRVMRDPMASLEEIATVVGRDMDLTATLIRRCNSAMYRGAEPVETADEAMLRLGLDAVLEMVMTLVMKSMYRLPAEAGLELAGLWDHSLLVGILTRQLMQHMDVSRPVSFTAGLLHDIGKVFFIKAATEEYVDVLRKARQRHRAVADLEEELLGTNHATIGGEMLSRWKLPANIVTGVWFHHHTELGGEQNRLARAIELADAISYVTGCGLSDQCARCENSQSILEILSLTPSELPRLIMNSLDEAEEIRRAIG